MMAIITLKESLFTAGHSSEVFVSSNKSVLSCLEKKDIFCLDASHEMALKKISFQEP